MNGLLEDVLNAVLFCVSELVFILEGKLEIHSYPWIRVAYSSCCFLILLLVLSRWRVADFVNSSSPCSLCFLFSISIDVVSVVIIEDLFQFVENYS